MAWTGLTTTGHGRAQAEAQQAAFDAAQTAARAKNSQPLEQLAPVPATSPHGDGGDVAHFDGGIAPGPCACNWRRDGRLGLAKRVDGSLIDGATCPKCGLALYAD